MSQPPSLNPSDFDGFAADYDAALNQGLSVSGEDKNYFAAGRTQWLKRCLEKLGQPPARIMDFGCGTGSATPFVLNSFDVQTLVGVDISEKSLEVARARHGSHRVSFAHMERYTPDGTLDLVFCNGVFHHIPLDRRAGAVDYVKRCLRPGGWFAMWENNPWNPGTRLVMSRIPFDRDAVTLAPPQARRLLEAGGFRVVRQDFLFYFPRPLAWLRPLERALVKLPLGAQYLTLGKSTP